MSQAVAIRVHGVTRFNCPRLVGTWLAGRCRVLACLHFVWKRSTAEPWRGIGPLDTVTAQALAKLDTSISQESGTPSGHVITLPIAPDDDENLTHVENGV